MSDPYGVDGYNPKPLDLNELEKKSTPDPYDLDGYNLPWVEARKREEAELEAKRKQTAVILEKLAEPFELEDIKWKPQVITKDGTKAMVIAYGDPRAYIERLNSVCGPGGWTASYEVHTVPFSGDAKHTGKIVVIATVSIEALQFKGSCGVHSSIGEDFLEGENSATAAEAQALKRACVPFGVGRYLYDLPRFWVKYDSEAKKITETPTMPDWAVPKRKCDKCRNDIKSYSHDGQEMSVTAVIAKSKREYGGQFCVDCMIIMKKAKTEKK
jgi:hypothetical protein